MGGTNREIGLLIQLCHDMDKAPSVADKALMRLTINNMSGAISREQKVIIFKDLKLRLLMGVFNNVLFRVKLKLSLMVTLPKISNRALTLFAKSGKNVEEALFSPTPIIY